MRRRCVLAFAAGLLCTLPSLTACLKSSASGPSGPGSGILFVGNSLTYWNDLPLIVQAIFDAARGDSYDVAMVAFPDVSLEDHWLDGTARNQIERGGWKIVVLQQGPSSLPESRTLLRDYVGRFSQRIKSIGARPALYSVWPQQSRVADFDRAIESYRIAADDVGGMFFPVADAWRAAWSHDSTLALYSADGLHPTVAGSYLAALVIYGVISGKSPVGLPVEIALRDGRPLTVPPAIAAVLQTAGAEAIRAAQ